MKRSNIAVACLALLVIGVGQVKADFVNASFETGDLTGWGGTATTDGFGLNPFQSHLWIGDGRTMVDVACGL